MLTVTDVELRVGARLLMDEVNFRVDKGDKVGLVGRNGAGKTTLTKVLAGGGQPTAGTVTRTGRIGYLPQDPKVEDMDQSGRDRILSARDLDQTIRRMREAEAGMAAVDDAERERAMNRYSRLEAEFEARGGYAAESEAARITSNLGLPDRVLDQPLHTLSGGQRRRVELARILFSDADILLLDEPTNHLDHDSIVWLRDYLKTYSGGLLMISHDVELMEMTVNKVLYLDANRQTMDVYNMTWKNYLAQRQQDEARRRREFANAEKKASALMAQAEKMRAKATKATAAQNMIKRAERLMRGVEGERAVDRVAAIRFPTPQASGKTTLLRMLAGEETPDTGEVQAGHGLKLGYFAQEHDTLDQDASVLDNMRHAAPQLGDTQARTLLGSFLFQGDDVDKPARVLSGGEKTRLALATLVASSANVLLLDEPTNNLDPASREEILHALRQYEGAVVLVTHDEGAVEALDPERVVLLPDGVEDLWNDDYRDLITLA